MINKRSNKRISRQHLHYTLRSMVWEECWNDLWESNNVQIEFKALLRCNELTELRNVCWEEITTNRPWIKSVKTNLNRAKRDE